MQRGRAPRLAGFGMRASGARFEQCQPSASGAASLEPEGVGTTAGGSGGAGPGMSPAARRAPQEGGEHSIGHGARLSTAAHGLPTGPSLEACHVLSTAVPGVQTLLLSSPRVAAVCEASNALLPPVTQRAAGAARYRARAAPIMAVASTRRGRLHGNRREEAW
eukprot:CAMPEP_0179272816 /NCGR_PEP_ID=MMETSP0797-20121207/32694_1 /TAXON_ID=47934 /ORGANISM="Dinophysis acuminata, Strain DAEP01" /LENGTH=162 /DNA_ID=CAMNT_0020981227 /DNA_START=161 /DNA_END=646 /DNA_ORIENTATION=-